MAYKPRHRRLYPVHSRISRIFTFERGYNSKELAIAIAALPEILRDYRELIAYVEKTNFDRTKKSKQVLKKAGQL